MSRLYANFAKGNLTASLNQGSATLTSTDLDSFLPLISSPDYMILVMDPTGTPELVKVTAYAGSGDTATVDRGEENTIDITHANSTEWRCVTTAAGEEGLADGTLWPDDVVIARHIGNGQVLEAALNTGAVTTNKIGDGQVTDSKVGTISGSKLSDASVPTAKLIDQPPVGTGEISNAMLADGSVTNLKIGSAEVKGGNIGLLEVDDTHLADGAVATNDKVAVGADIDGAKLLDASITTAKLIDEFFPAVVGIQSHGTSFTLDIDDQSEHLRLTAALTITVPTNASVALPIGCQVTFFSATSGLVDFAAAGGVTINASDPTPALAGEHSGAMLIKVATDEWDLIGSIA